MLESVPKSFSWSFSRLKAFEDCPRRYHETQVLKDEHGKPLWPEEPSAILQYGDDVHKAMAVALMNNTPLPAKYRIYQKWIDSVNNTAGELLVEDECRWAINRDLEPTTWFAKDVWLRCIADAVKLDLTPADKLPTALVVDWKAGKSINGDPIQLMLTSLMLFRQWPALMSVRADFIWLQENTQTTQSLFKDECKAQWRHLLPRVTRLENATKNNHFPPQPGRFCRRWCPVKSCEYNGK
jgi:hypothetical protein